MALIILSIPVKISGLFAFAGACNAPLLRYCGAGDMRASIIWSTWSNADSSGLEGIPTNLRKKLVIARLNLSHALIALP